MYFSPSVFGWRWTFFPLDKSSVANGRLELDVAAGFHSSWDWCSWRRFVNSFRIWLTQVSRLESPPAWCSGGSTAWQSMSAFLSLIFLAVRPERKVLQACLPMLENKGFTTAEETEKLLWVNVVCVMMCTNGVSCVHMSPVNDPQVIRWPPPGVEFCWVAQVLWVSPAMILPMTLPWFICLSPWFVCPWLRCGWWTGLRQFITLVGSINKGAIIEVVWVTFVGWWCILTAVWRLWQFANVKSSLNSNPARAYLRYQHGSLPCALHTNWRFSSRICLTSAYDWAIGTSPNRIRCREEATTLAKSLTSCHSCTKYKISSKFSLLFNVLRVRNRFWNVQRMQCGQHDF